MSPAPEEMTNADDAPRETTMSQSSSPGDDGDDATIPPADVVVDDADDDDAVRDCASAAGGGGGGRVVPVVSPGEGQDDDDVIVVEVSARGEDEDADAAPAVAVFDTSRDDVGDEDGDDAPAGGGVGESPPSPSAPLPPSPSPSPSPSPPIPATPLPGGMIGLKFQYAPTDDERPYYDGLFRLVASGTADELAAVEGGDDGDVILPPGDAARLFLSSGVPPDRLRLVWNMAVAPAVPYPPDVRPPPAMTRGQFRNAVRLIQLFQNGAMAKDEGLGVGGGTEEANLAPPLFEGISGVAVPLPTTNTTNVPPRRRSSSSKPNNSLTRSWNDGVNVAPDGPMRRRTRSSGGLTEKPNNSLTRSWNDGVKVTVMTSSPGVPTRRRSSEASNGAGGPMRRRTRSSDGMVGRMSRRNSEASNGAGGPMRRRSSEASNGAGGPTRRRSSEGRDGGVVVVTPRLEDYRYSMSRDERLTYRETFERHCVSDDGHRRRHVYVDAAVAFFERSGLGRDALGMLWDVVARDPNAGKLDEREFAIMTHLLVCATRRGLPIPDALPAPLRIWRDGSGGGGGDDDADADADYYADAERRAGNEVDGGSSSNRQRPSNVRDDNERMKRMEREIRSLKGLVASLRIEIRDLKEVVVHAGDAKYGGILNGVPSKSVPASTSFSNRDALNVDDKMYSGERNDVLDASDRTEEKRRGENANGFPARKRLSNSDAPNVDVEMYWGERKGHPDLDWSEQTVIPTDLSTMSSTVNRMPVPARRPPSSLRNSVKKRSEIKRIIPGMSQNIPPIHPSSSGSRASRKSTKPSIPQSQHGDAIPAASDYALGVTKSVVYSPTDNLATQMQRVQQGEKFDTLMQTTMEKIKFGDSGSKNSGSKNSVSKVSWPKPITRKRLDAASRQESARHIRRSVFGKTEIYKGFDEPRPSTEAVNLPPL